MTTWKDKVIHVRVYLDGNQWCALIGEDIMSGTNGWGNTPEAALTDLVKELQIQKDLIG